jgi:farnesyl diphosphate synthase
MSNATLNHFLAQGQQRINRYLEQQLPPLSKAPERLHRAMHYAVLNGGKRLRPLLVYACGTAFGAKLETLDAPAAAVELIHCYSLVHDDLPAMDDDDLRRGKPTCHKAFNEATAILVGDALQSFAFEHLCDQPELSENIKLQMIKTLAMASGSQGMAGGQDLDLAAENKACELTQLETIHHLKTGALIQASIQLGAISAGCEDKTTLSQLKKFAEYIGLAFQIHDDILDVEGDAETIGKMPGADVANHKATYPAMLGLTEAKHRREKVYTAAIETLKTLTLDTSHLSELCKHIVERHY